MSNESDALVMEMSYEKLQMLVALITAAFSVTSFGSMTVSVLLASTSFTTFATMAIASTATLIVSAIHLVLLRSHGAGKWRPYLVATFGAECGFIGVLSLFWVGYLPLSSFICHYRRTSVEETVFFWSFSFSWIASLASLATLATLISKQNAQQQVVAVVGRESKV